MSGFNKYQRAMLDHLSSPTRSSDVENDLNYLVQQGFFADHSEQSTIDLFNSLVAVNARNWCGTGIARARIALGIPEPKKSFKVGDMVTFDEAKTLPNGSHLNGQNAEMVLIGSGLYKISGERVSYFINGDKRKILSIPDSK